VPLNGRLVRRTWTYDPALYAPPRYRRACSYEAFLPDELTGPEVRLSGDLAGVVSDAEAAVHRLNAIARPALVPLARLLLRTESIASSRIEGMQMDARDLARAEVRLETGAKAGPTATEILANIDAMELAVSEASTADDLQVADIVRIHTALMAGASNSHVAGRIRDEQNWIGGNNYNPCGAAYVPPPPEHVPELLADLCLFASQEVLPPLVQAGLAHAQFETIHPFMDGNGRTGRALIQVILRRRGLAPAYVPPVSVVLASDKEAHIKALTDFRGDSAEEWLMTFAVAMTRAADLAARYLRSTEELQAKWREQLRAAGNPRRGSAAWTIIDQLPGHPLITVPVAVAVTGLTKAVVGQAMEHLQSAGVLTRASGGARNRTWEASGLLDLLNDLENGA
jgi:Fic family protein